MNHTWTTGWQSRVRAIVEQMGYEDVFAFVMAHPGKSFGQLYGMIQKRTGGHQTPVAFVQLPEVFFEDAKSRGLLREAVMESLVRSMQQHLRKGWNIGKNILPRRIDAR